MYGVAGGAWYCRLAVSNPHDDAVAFEVTAGYPAVSGECEACSEPSRLVIPPHETVQFLHPVWSEGNEFLVAGALEIETTKPLAFHLTYLWNDGIELRQSLPVARDWLPAGEHVALVETGESVRLNAVIVNPNDSPATVSVRIGDRPENEVRVRIAPRRSLLVSLPPETCGGERCIPNPGYPPPPAIIHFASDSAFLAGVSSVGPSFATFSLAGTKE